MKDLGAMFRIKRLVQWSSGILTLMVSVLGCAPQNEYVEPPPPRVTVAKPLVHDITNYLEETGSTEASEFVEIRARVKGFLEQVNFEPGDDVKAVDPAQLASVPEDQRPKPLYVIDKKPFLAQVRIAEAQRQVAIAEATEAKAKYDRAVPLKEKGAIATEELEEYRATWEVAQARIAGMEANLLQARIDLGYCDIWSPIDGRIGKTDVYAGSLVGSGESTYLTKVVKYDPIFATIQIPEAKLLRIIDAAHQDKARVSKDDLVMELRRDIDDRYLFRGKLDYAAQEVDPETGTYSIRGAFPNEDFRLVPGIFVRVRIPVGTTKNAILVPERAVTTDPAGKYLLVIDTNKEVERRDVKLGNHVGNMVVVTEGLGADDSFILDGLQQARPGIQVDVQEADPLPLPADLQAAAEQPPAETSEPEAAAQPTEEPAPANEEAASMPQEPDPAPEEASQEPAPTSQEPVTPEPVSEESSPDTDAE